MDKYLIDQLVDLGFNADKHRLIFVDVKKQELILNEKGSAIERYPISTSKFGTGNQMGSNKTPIGAHIIHTKIGQGERVCEVFKGRVPQGYQEPIESKGVSTGKDAITSRIMWLKGLQEGVNLGADVDSYDRYIYIHGTHEEGLIGQPASIGCVRMKNDDVIELFELVKEGDFVFIQA